LKIKKLTLVILIILTIITIGSVNASDNQTTDDLSITDNDENIVLSSNIDVDNNDTSQINENIIISNTNNNMLKENEIIITPENISQFGQPLQSGNYKFIGEFNAPGIYVNFNEGCIINASQANFIDMGIVLNGNVEINGLTMSTTHYNSFYQQGALIYATGDNNVLENLNVEYLPDDDNDVYAILLENANDFKLLNSIINFTGTSLSDYYEYAIKITDSHRGLIKNNTVIANLPILNVDYTKGNPGLDTDLVLNTGIKESSDINLTQNTFIANVIDRNGEFPTFDCVMFESCENINICDNIFNESDFITNVGETNYLNVLDIYYSNHVLVKNNFISVETDGGCEDAGTSYPIQLTGPYEDVVIDGNDLYAYCRGPALGIFSQNYYGNTEILVQNNNINITGLPTFKDWGLVSGIELQDNVARVYNNTIVTKSVTGNYEDGMHLFGISYAQALNDDHNYDIRGNSVVTEGKYAIYLLKAEDTVIANNNLVSSLGEGDSTVYIKDASGTTIIENNTKETNIFIETGRIWSGYDGNVKITVPEGTRDVTVSINGVVIATVSLNNGVANVNIPANYINAGENTIKVTYDGSSNSTAFYPLNNTVTQSNFNQFFTNGELNDDVPFDELIFKGEFKNLDENFIMATVSIIGDNATLYDTRIMVMNSNIKLDKLNLIAQDSLGALIAVHEVDNVQLTNLNISYTTGDEMGVAIDIYYGNACILNSTIFFESHVTSDEEVSVAIQAVETQNVLMDNNNIITKLPCVYVYTYDDDYYLMGSNNVNPVRLKNCNNLTFTNNFINSTTNNYSAEFPTIQSIYIIGCSNSLIDHNEISMIDEMTPEGMDNYLYGIDFGFNINVTFSYNKFNMFTKGGKEAAGTAYAFQGVESEVIIKGNIINSVSNGPNLGIYVASMAGGTSKLLIEDNIINVTGHASSIGTWALVSGIEIQNGDAKIYNNTINTYNVNTYDDKAYIYGISYAQWMYGDRSFEIRDNTIYSEGKYTISVIDSDYLYVTNNRLYAHDLEGDESVNSGNCSDVIIANNTQQKPIIIMDIEDCLYGSDNQLNITFTNVNGSVTIKINGKEIAVEEIITNQTKTYTILASDIIQGENTIEVDYNSISQFKTFKTLGNIITNKTFFKYFDENGILHDTVLFDELIFNGEFSNLVNYITVDKQLTITGDNAVLNNMAFIISADNVCLNNMTLIAGDLGNLIDVAGKNALISNMNITYIVNYYANAINIYAGADGAKILNNTIYFESTVDDYAVDDVTNAICVNSGVSIFDDEDPITGIIISNNNITAIIPAFLADVYEHEYYVMGLSAVNGVRINGAENLIFTKNNLNVKTNRLDRTTPTYQALYIASSSGLIDGNNISMIDTFTPKDKDVYLYAIEVLNDNNLIISNNTFNLSTTGGKANAGAAYAIQAVNSDFTIDNNIINTKSFGPNLAIYFPSNMGAPCNTLIQNNKINVTGLAGNNYNSSLVSGIEVQTGDIIIQNNIISTYNIGDYNANNHIYAISYCQDGVISQFNIVNNTLTTEGHYAISFIETNDAIINENILITKDLYGDGAIFIGNGSGNIIKDNYPIKTQVTISVNDTDINKPITITVSVNPNVNGSVKVNVNGVEYPVTINNEGKGQITIGKLPENNYTAFVTFISENIKYLDSNNQTSFEVFNNNPTVKINVGEVIIGNDVCVTVNTTKANGNITLVIDGEEHVLKLENNTASYIIKNITSGNHSIIAIYMNDKMAFNSTIISIEKLTPEIIITPINTQYAKKAFSIAVTNNTEVTITINGKPYDLINGIINIDDGLDAGEYILTATASENDKYNAGCNSTKFKVIKQSSNIESVIVPTKDIIIGQNTTIKVTMADEESGIILININNVNYTAAINNKTAILNLNLPINEYNVKITYLGDDKYNNTGDYNAQFNVVDKNNTIIPISISGNIEIDGEITITATATSGENVILTVNGEKITGNKYTIPSAGTYEITASSDENNQFHKGFNKTSFIVLKQKASIIIDEINTVNVGEEIAINVVNSSGSIIIAVNGIILNDTKFTPNKAGDYVIEVKSLENNKYYAGFNSTTFNVVKNQPVINISASEVTDGKLVVMVTLPEDATGTVLVNINGTLYLVKSENNIKQDNLTVILDNPGIYYVNALYMGNEKYNGVESDTIAVNVSDIKPVVNPIATEFSDVLVNKDLTINAVLKDIMGNLISNVTVNYVIGNVTGNVTTDVNGSFSILAKYGVSIKLSYLGSDIYLPCDTSLTLDNITPVVPVKTDTHFNIIMFSSYNLYAVDLGAGERGKVFSFRLIGANGNGVANANVTFSFKTNSVSLVTDENGYVQIDFSTWAAGTYYSTLSYGGDETYVSSYAPFIFNVLKKPIAIVAANKKFKAKSKSKKYVVTLKTQKCDSRDGKIYLSAGKPVTLNLKGKTYVGKINSKGQAVFKLKITKKGKYSATIRFDGDMTYSAASKVVKIKIK